MKKITTSVAALAIAISTFGQTNNDEYMKHQKDLQAFEHQIDDLISAIRMDMYYGFLDQDKGTYYVNNMMKLKSRNRDIMFDMWRQRSVTLGEHQAKLK